MTTKTEKIIGLFALGALVGISIFLVKEYNENKNGTEVSENETKPEFAGGHGIGGGTGGVHMGGEFPHASLGYPYPVAYGGYPYYPENQLCRFIDKNGRILTMNCNPNIATILDN